MRNFFKIIFGSCLGTILALVGIFGILLIVSLVSKPSNEISKNSVLVLDFSSFIPEKTDNIKRDKFSFESSKAIGLRTYERIINKAAEDVKISGILLKNTSPYVGNAGLYDLRASLESFKESGKWIYSYADYHSQKSYQLNLAADSIFLNPNGWIDLKGYGYLSPFFKDALDNLGIKAEVFYAGDYKSATEPFRRNDMSPENREQVKEFLDEMVAILTEDISESRNIDKNTVNRVFNTYAGKSAYSAKSHNLIDDILYYDQVEAKLKNRLGVKENKKIKYISISKYAKSIDLTEKGDSKNKIAIVYAEGEVLYGSNEYGSISDQKYLKIFDRLKRDKKLKAVVLRVNSPGGSSLTSDIIWREVENLKEKGIPVIASFGDYAASGGYYIACGADTIVSSPSTLTGSIGVFSMLFNARELANDKLKVHFDTLKTHPMAIGLTSFYDPNEQERQLIKESVDTIYSVFLDRVANGRNMSKEAVHQVGQGRIWTGQKALELGLVDELGDLDKAISIAAEAAEIDDYKIKEYPTVKENFIAKLMSEIDPSENVVERFEVDGELLDYYKKYQSAIRVMETKEPLMRLPFMLEN